MRWFGFACGSEGVWVSGRGSLYLALERAYES